MWLSDFLLFFIVPPSRKDDSPPIARAGPTLVWMLIGWAVLFVFGLAMISPTCSDTPDSSMSLQGGNSGCSPTTSMNIAVIIGVVALAIVLLYPVVTHFRPPRKLALRVTAEGLESVYSRWIGVIFWEQIEALALYETFAYSRLDSVIRYLVVTLHSSEGLHDEPVLERIWSRYPRVPDMERVAIMLPLNRLTDANGAKITATEMLERIQICFPNQIEENAVEMREDMLFI